MLRKRITRLCSIAIALTATLMVETVIARPRPHYGYYMKIQQIASDVSTPEKRAQAITELMGIVQNTMNNIHLRQFAAEKLGELRAIASRNVLKTLANSLEWTDSTRYLKRSVTLAYWQIRVAEEPTREAQEQLLIKLLWGKNHPPPHADVVPWWAADELANRGVQEALPEIVKSIRYRDPSERGEEQIRLCTAKIELLTTSASRQDAFTQGLAMEDFTQRQQLRRWAINELGNLATEESRSILIAYALELQNKYYDENGMRIKLERDRFGYAGEFYRRIIEILKDGGMSESDMIGIGLRPDRFFVVAP